MTIITSNDNMIVDVVIKNLQAKFPVRNLGGVGYFSGIEVARKQGELFLSQRNYITDLLQRIQMAEANLIATPACTRHARTHNDIFHNPTMYRSIVGNL